MQLDEVIKSLYVIGDVHAQKAKLDALLTEIGFTTAGCDSIAPTSQLVFIGDLIDNKVTDNDQHLATLQMVHALQQNKRAFCLLGNHEFNAIGWATKNHQGEFCRPHIEKNVKQHQAFLDAVVDGSAKHDAWIEWFKSLPLFLEFDAVTAIHACWNENAIARIKPYLNADNSLKEAHWADAFDEQHALFALCEMLLKGPERRLPEGEFFIDKTGTQRTQQRVQWWHDYAGDKPVVIGHYTLNDQPKMLADKVVCVDYNAAKGNNPLVAYRFDAQVEKNTALQEDFYYDSN